MNLVYIDESGNTGLNLKDTQQPVFLLAALVLDSSKWFQMEEQFFGILRNHFSAGALQQVELHAMDLRVGRRSFKEIVFAERLKIRDEMLELLVEHETPIIYRRIIKTRFAMFCDENYGPGIKINPYIMALPFICIEVNHYLHEKGPDELGMLIFDEQKESFVDVERSVRTLRLDPKSILKTTRLVEKGFFVDSSKSFALQLVDLAAYYIRKYEESLLGHSVSHYDEETFGPIKTLISTGIGSKMPDILEWVKHNFIK